MVELVDARAASSGTFGAARINNPSTTNQLYFDLQSPKVLTIKARYFPSTRTARTRSLRPLFLPNGGLFWLSWPLLFTPASANSR